jgi:hypothetical protein
MPSFGASLPLAGVSFPVELLPGPALLGLSLGATAPGSVPLAEGTDPEKAGTSALDSSLDGPHAAASTSKTERDVMREWARENDVMLKLPRSRTRTWKRCQTLRANDAPCNTACAFVLVSSAEAARRQRDSNDSVESTRPEFRFAPPRPVWS